MEYLKPKFTVPLGSEAYQEGWERVFGRKGRSKTPPEGTEKPAVDEKKAQDE